MVYEWMEGYSYFMYMTVLIPKIIGRFEYCFHTSNWRDIPTIQFHFFNDTFHVIYLKNPRIAEFYQ